MSSPSIEKAKQALDLGLDVEYKTKNTAIRWKKLDPKDKDGYRLGAIKAFVAASIPLIGGHKKELDGQAIAELRAFDGSEYQIASNPPKWGAWVKRLPGCPPPDVPFGAILDVEFFVDGRRKYMRFSVPAGMNVTHFWDHPDMAAYRIYK